jgi:hypothetical protein
MNVVSHSSFIIHPFLLLIAACILHLTTVQAQTSFTLSGYIKDAATGETLIGANIFNKAKSDQGTTSNIYGFYSITLPKGTYKIAVSYLGYQEKIISIDLEKNNNQNIELSEGVEMKEVVITGERKDENVQSTEMGTVVVPIDAIKKMPALMGEVDVLKAIQLLPGVKSAGEGGSGFYVRGGGVDQNLVLLDDATVYNSGHLLGFFSVFNADAIKNTTLIKGGMPANYGGRLSSVVDIQMKDGNDKKYGVEGGIGLISSRITAEGPILKERSSFMISARRTYALDLAQPYIKTTNFAGTNYYFYDLNTKLNYRISEKDRLYLSGYFGRDVLNYSSSKRGFSFSLPYGNSTGTLRWNHLFSNKLFMNTSIIYNDYDFQVKAGQETFKVELFSGVKDWNAKMDFDYFPNTAHAVKFGANYTYHEFIPSIARGQSGDVVFSNNKVSKFAHEAAVYINDDWKVNRRLSLSYGLRATGFSQIANQDLTTVDKRFVKKGGIVKTYYGIEPRVSGKLSLTSASSIKGGVTLTNQYVHLVSNSTSTFASDLWVASSDKIKPQVSLQYATGYFHNFSDNMYETSVEVYYKDMFNQIDYSEFFVQNGGTDVEEEFVFGKGRSYGAEFFLRKAKGKLNGWIGYTWSRTNRTFKDINNNNPFPVNYDRRHDMSVVANYQISPKWEASGVFVFYTGNAYTPIESIYFVNNSPITQYGIRNSSRLPNYHRMDLSATYTRRPGSEKRFKSSWTFAAYNTYNRLNTFFTYYDYDVNANTGATKATAYKVTIFPIIPSITWNFKWK